jgi:hypothetical protein
VSLLQKRDLIEELFVEQWIAQTGMKETRNITTGVYKIQARKYIKNTRQEKMHPNKPNSNNATNVKCKSSTNV